MTLLAVNFHYIHEENLYPYPGIYSVSVERFKNQVDQLGKFFEFISQEDLVKALTGEKRLPEKSCLITFDDGLSCQYENVLPVLDSKKIPAVFFVCGKPLEEKRALAVHKIHWLRAHIEPNTFFAQIRDIYQELTGENFDIEKFNTPSVQDRKFYIYDTSVNAKIKLILNKLLDFDLRDKIINRIFNELVSDEQEFCRKFYMNSNQIKDLYKRGWLGIHTYSHLPLSILNRQEVKDEYTRCIEVLSKAIQENKIQISGISYPYGGPEYVSKEVAQAAREVGLDFGFTMERSLNQTLKEPTLLARVDTNDVPGGRSPMFSINNKDFTITNPSLNKHRTVYFTETL